MKISSPRYAAMSNVDASVGSPQRLAMQGDARRPVRFHGRLVGHAFLVRCALQTLGKIIWSDFGDSMRALVLDPIVSVYDDRLVLEGFSSDQSLYGRLDLDRSLFEAIGPVQPGTTNIDFTWWLYDALRQIRSSRETFLQIGPEGLGLVTGDDRPHVEEKVDVSDDWVRGFLNLQSAMSMPGTMFRMRAVDLLHVIRYVQQHRAPQPPRALRFEFVPGSDVRVVLEPWEHAVPLKGAVHGYTEQRVIRTWGRNRLEVVESLLPYADEVEVYLKGRALPSFYVLRLPGITLTAGLSGWAENAWSGTSGFGLLSSDSAGDEALLRRAGEHLERMQVAGREDLARVLGEPPERVGWALQRLCRQGHAMMDLRERRYRHRQLFQESIDEPVIFPPDRRLEEARRLIAGQRVTVRHCGIRETVKDRQYRDPNTGGLVLKQVVYHEWLVQGSAGEQPEVELVINDDGRIIFGRCGCEHFRLNHLNQGPCEHMLALYMASVPQRPDGAVPPVQVRVVKMADGGAGGAADDGGEEDR